MWFHLCAEGLRREDVRQECGRQQSGRVKRERPKQPHRPCSGLLSSADQLTAGPHRTVRPRCQFADAGGKSGSDPPFGDAQDDDGQRDQTKYILAQIGHPLSRPRSPTLAHFRADKVAAHDPEEQ